MNTRFFISLIRMPFYDRINPVMISSTRKALYHAFIEHGQIYYIEANNTTITNCSYTQFLERYNLQKENNKAICLFKFKLNGYDEYIDLFIYELEINQLKLI